MSAWDDATEFAERQDNIGSELADRESIGWLPGGDNSPEQVARRAEVVSAVMGEPNRPRPLGSFEMLRRHVMDWGMCRARESCDCSDAVAWRWLRDRGVHVD